LKRLIGGGADVSGGVGDAHEAAFGVVNVALGLEAIGIEDLGDLAGQVVLLAPGAAEGIGKGAVIGPLIEAFLSDLPDSIGGGDPVAAVVVAASRGVAEAIRSGGKLSFCCAGQRCDENSYPA